MIQNKLKIFLLSLITFISFSSVIQSVSADWLSDLCEETKGKPWEIGCDSKTTFTNFKGEFKAPDPELYSEEITRVRNVREYILNVLNFALGFLGIIAVGVVIYGGYSYVVSMGETDAADKAKKNITYAVIGILIILSSYALINTVLQATTGEAPSPHGSGSEISKYEEENLVNYATKKVMSFSQDFFTAYQNYYSTQSQMNELIAFSEKAYREIKKQMDDSGTDMDDFTEDLIGDDRKDIAKKNAKQPVLDIQNGVNSISAYAGQLSHTKGKIDAINTYINKILTEQYSVTHNLKNLLIPKALAEEPNYKTGCKSDTKIPDVFDENHLQCYLKNIKEASRVDYNNAVEKVKKELSDLQNEIGDQLSGDVITAFEELIKGNGLLDKLKVVSDNSYNFKEVDRAALQKTADTMVYIIEKLSTLQFFDARIVATAKEGKAPLSVRFDALKSRDPIGREIVPDQYYWQYPASSSVKCSDQYSPVLTCKFTTPGAYTVKLIVDDNKWSEAGKGEDLKTPDYDDKNHPNNLDAGAGKDQITIMVSPPASNLILKATVTGESNSSDPISLVNYSENSRYTEVAFKVSITEAKNGVVFNACASTDSSEGKITKWSWDFGDNTPPAKFGEGANTTTSLGGDACNQTHYYPQEGVYPLVIEVEDQYGVKDKAMVAVYVADLVARIIPNKTSGIIGDKITFNGSTSSSYDNYIAQYKWNINKPDGTPVPVTELYGEPTEEDITYQDEKISYTFTQTGVYKVSLKIINGENESDKMEIEIPITSNPPIANFNYSIPDETHPGTYLLDASKTYDLDSDTLYYYWEVQNGEVQIEQDNITSPFAYITFPNIGDYKVKLIVGDGELKNDKENFYSDEELKTKLINKSEFEKTIKVSKVLSVELKADPSVLQLKSPSASNNVFFTRVNAQSNTATVSFTINSNDSEATFTLDTGDGNVETGIIKELSGNKFEYTYLSAGRYTAELLVSNTEGEQNSTKIPIIIGNGDSPIPVITVFADSNEVKIINGQAVNVFYKNTKITFDASRSVNIKGSNDNLSYEWDFDGLPTQTLEKKQQKVNFVHKTLKNIEEHSITLKVFDQTKNKNNPIASELSIPVKLIFSLITPNIQGIQAKPVNDADNTTPLEIVAEAAASDLDGKITQYRWYYSKDNVAEPKDDIFLFTTKSNRTQITIPTEGTEGEKADYWIYAEVVDDDGRTSKPDELTDSSKISVIYGKNNQPDCKINILSTSNTVDAGTPVDFQAECTDPDDKIEDLCFAWDFEGDGIYDIGTIRGTDGSCGQMQGTLSQNELPQGYKINSSKQRWTYEKAKFTGDPYSLTLMVEDSVVPMIFKLPVYVEPTSPKPSIHITNIQTLPENPKNPAEVYLSINYESEAAEAFTDCNTNRENPCPKITVDLDTKTDRDNNGNPRDDSDGRAIDYQVGDKTKKGIWHSDPGKFKQMRPYEIEMTIYDSEGQSASYKETVNITLPDVVPPKADFDCVTDGLILKCNAETKSTGGTNAIESYNWDFDTKSDTGGESFVNDDDFDDKKTKKLSDNGGKVEYTYDDYKTYEILLEVNATGLKDVKNKTFTLKAPDIKDPKPKLSYEILKDAPSTGKDIKVKLDASESEFFQENVPDEFWYDCNAKENSDGVGTSRDDFKKDTANSTRADQICEYNYGNHTVILKVKEGDLEVILTKDLTLTAPNVAPPVADFNHSVENGVLTANASKSKSFNGTLKYEWDLDLNEDGNKDGDPENDYVSLPAFENKADNSYQAENHKIIHYQYSSEGTKKIKLKVTDNGGSGIASSKLKTISISPFENSERSLKAGLTSNKDGFDGKIHLKADETGSDYVNFSVISSTGPIKEYYLDKNIYFDSDNNTLRGDDKDLKTNNLNENLTWESVAYNINFIQPPYNKITARLTVVSYEGKTDSVDVDIVFDPPSRFGDPTAAFLYEIAKVEEKTDGSYSIEVKFTNTSKAAESAKITSYRWDKDLKENGTDGDNNSGNDIDAEIADPTFIYEYLGNRSVKLTVCDDQTPTACSNIIKTIEIEDPDDGAYEEIDARLWSTDRPPSPIDGNIHLKSPKDMVTFDWRGSIGNNLNHFGIDKNINFDSNGNKDAGDDYEVFTERKTWKTDYEEAWGSEKPIIVRLLVKNKYGQSDKVEYRIVFDKPLSANILIYRDEAILILLASILIFVILYKSGLKRKIKMKINKIR